jgi:hypothetical protein
MSRAGHLSRIMVLLNSIEGKQTALQTDSVIVTDNLATIQEKFIDKTIGNFAKMTEIDFALAHTLGLDLAWAG